MLTMVRGILALLFFGAPLVHLVFLIPALQQREHAGMRRRVLHLLVSLGWAGGLAGVFLLPDGPYSWLALGIGLVCCGVEVRLALLEAKAARQAPDQGAA